MQSRCGDDNVGMAKIGKVLTEERVRELLSTSFLYKVLRDAPSMSEESELDLLKGAVDLQFLGYPDEIQRPKAIALCMEAARSGFLAVVLKSHAFPTAAASWLIENSLIEWIRSMELQPLKVFGGIVLNESVGGLNPKAVRSALKFPNCKVIWMPTVDSQNHRKEMHLEGGISVLSASGELKPEVKEIISIVKQSGQSALLNSGHLAGDETVVLSEECSVQEVNLIANHVNQELTRLTKEQMEKVANNGGYLGLYAAVNIPNFYLPVCDPTEAPKIISEFGAEYIAIASDCGQMLNFSPIEGLRIFTRSLLSQGITKDQMEIMLKKNPLKIIDL